MRRRSAARSEKFACLDFLAERAQFAADASACSSSASTGGRARASGGASAATICAASTGIREETGHVAWARARSVAAETVGVEVEDFPLGAQPVESGRVSGCLAPGEDV